MSTEALSNDEFQQIKVEPESMLNLAEQNKATSDSSDVDTTSEPMTGKFCYKISSLTLFSSVYVIYVYKYCELFIK